MPIRALIHLAANGLFAHTASQATPLMTFRKDATGEFVLVPLKAAKVDTFIRDLFADTDRHPVLPVRFVDDECFFDGDPSTLVCENTF